jgi:hypothetical protein
LGLFGHGGVDSAFWQEGETGSGPFKGKFVLGIEASWSKSRVRLDLFLPRAETTFVADSFKDTNLLINGEKS